MSSPVKPIAAPFFEDLRVGEVAASAPALTLTDGHAALHQAILGDRLRLPLDAGLCAEVVGSSLPVAHPGLVWDVSIGQSTVVTQRVLANLFYRGLVLHRAPLIGDTLATSVETVALRQNKGRLGRPATGLALLRVRTFDQEKRPVLDFHRCAMLPLRDQRGRTGHADDLAAVAATATELGAGPLAASVAGWRLDSFRRLVAGEHFADVAAGARWEVEGDDVVSAAPELARLTLNVATAHRDRYASGREGRLVYGGHTIGIAAAQLSRALPNLVTIVGWHACDHLAPVLEGDTLHSEVELERAEPLAGGGGLVHLLVRTRARREGASADVLHWRLVGVMA
ncbi:MAG TPA: MaoC family dehydratase [Solirubrobacterales bacterium]|nr:MaoC family dehydratase [Solirubrobacterales bacterium]